MPPDLKELTDRVSHVESLFEEIRKIVGTILEWKSGVNSGIRVMVWVVGGVQSIVLVCLGFAANSLNHTATTLGNHAVELATAKAEIKAYMSDEKFTADRNAASEAALKDELQSWVREEIERHSKP